MTEREGKFRRINWDKIGGELSDHIRLDTTDYERAILSQFPELAQSHQIVLAWLKEAVNDCLAVFGLDCPLKITIWPHANTQQAPIVFEAADNPNEPHRISFTEKYYTDILITLTSLAEKQFEKTIISEFLRVIPELLVMVAHELYHLRQYEQKPDFYNETLLANSQITTFVRDNNISNLDNIPQEIMRIYTSDKGEKAATGFAIRYLIEKRKKLPIDSQELIQAFILQTAFELERIKK